jgi:hypothetical protein
MKLLIVAPNTNAVSETFEQFRQALEPVGFIGKPAALEMIHKNGDHLLFRRLQTLADVETIIGIAYDCFLQTGDCEGGLVKRVQPWVEAKTALTEEENRTMITIDHPEWPPITTLTGSEKSFPPPVDQKHNVGIEKLKSVAIYDCKDHSYWELSEDKARVVFNALSLYFSTRDKP